MRNKNLELFFWCAAVKMAKSCQWLEKILKAPKTSYQKRAREILALTLRFFQHMANKDLTALYILKWSFSACWFSEFVSVFHRYRGATAQVPMVSQTYSGKYTESSATFGLWIQPARTCALPIDLILTFKWWEDRGVKQFYFSTSKENKETSIQTTYLKHLLLTESIRDKFPEADAVNIAVNSMYTAATRTEPNLYLQAIRKKGCSGCKRGTREPEMSKSQVQT